ncbi:MAG: hypothetical protein RM021_033380 [Nostoc sp. EkiNYC01]|nr:hypothetical protein [Nostoc sp. EkiNYC01]
MCNYSSYQSNISIEQNIVWVAIARHQRFFDGFFAECSVNGSKLLLLILDPTVEHKESGC